MDGRSFDSSVQTIIRNISFRGHALLLPVKAFSTRVRDDLRAGTSSVNLADISPNYYHLGLEVSKMYHKRD